MEKPGRPAEPARPSPTTKITQPNQKLEMATRRIEAERAARVGRAQKGSDPDCVAGVSWCRLLVRLVSDGGVGPLESQEVAVKFLMLLHSPTDAPKEGTAEAARANAECGAALQMMRRPEC